MLYVSLIFKIFLFYVLILYNNVFWFKFLYLKLKVNTALKFDYFQDLSKKVRGILNKLTPQKFETLVEQVKNLDINTEEKLNIVIDLVFEKAIDEPNFSVPYANMCKQLALVSIIYLQIIKVREYVVSQLKLFQYPFQIKVPLAGQPGQFVNFRKLLLTKCQKEFEQDRCDELKREDRMKAIEAAESAVS